MSDFPEITRDSPSELDPGSEEDIEYRRRSGKNQLRRRLGRKSSEKENARVFVALFDYDPPTMSPNPEACDDELAFREGQLIKVGVKVRFFSYQIINPRTILLFQIIGEKDSDGFYWGECNGYQGYVPCNMVSEVQVDDERFLQDIVTSKVNNSLFKSCHFVCVWSFGIFRQFQNFALTHCL